MLTVIILLCGPESRNWEICVEEHDIKKFLRALEDTSFKIWVLIFKPWIFIQDIVCCKCLTVSWQIMILMKQGLLTWHHSVRLELTCETKIFIQSRLELKYWKYDRSNLASADVWLRSSFTTDVHRTVLFNFALSRLCNSVDLRSATISQTYFQLNIMPYACSLHHHQRCYTYNPCSATFLILWL